MLFTIIVHPDRVQRMTLRSSISSSEQMEFQEFDGDADLLDWLRTSQRKVDFLFLTWDLTAEKRRILGDLRALPAAAEALIFMTSSRRDVEWISTLFHTPGIIEGLAEKPFRISAFIRNVQRLLVVDLMAKPCALVVEDDKETRETLRDYLREFGFHKVLEAGDGRAAWETLKVHRDEVSIVLSDWNMPVMTGIELLREIRHTPSLARLPFLMVTTKGPIEQIKTIHAAESGVDGYLPKPFNLSSFHSQMETLLQDISKHRRAEAYVVAGRALLAQGSPKAEETINEALKLLPSESALWEVMGDIHCFRSKTERTLPQACEAYEHALKLCPLNTPLVMKCFECYTALGRMNDAVKVLRAHLNRAELDDGLYTRLGKIYLQNGELEAAAEQFRRAIASNPTNTEAQSLYQSVLMHARPRKAA